MLSYNNRATDPKIESNSFTPCAVTHTCSALHVLLQGIACAHKCGHLSLTELSLMPRRLPVTQE